jgi:pimeloyl-ACP methyl ester carboxylesterase
MKKIILIVFMLISFFSAEAQNISGSWKGALDLQVQKLNIVFHFKTDASGKDVCTLDSPDQGAKDIPATLNFISKDSVNLSIASLNVTYAGKLHDGVIKGLFTQGGMSLPLDIKPGEVIRNRPQNPTLPLAYKTEELSFTNTSANATLSGTLSYPVNYTKGQKVPVMLMVTGSGLENRDEEVFDHKPFLIIADYLAKHGIATFRYDDRGFGKSTGNASNATTKDFAEDALAGVKMLRGMKIFSKVGVLGHSEGASIAFILGAKGAVDFVVSMAGVGVKGDTALAAQVNKMMELKGSPERTTTQMYRRNAAMSGSVWLNYFIDYDPIPDIKATKCPVMAINGDKDTQVISSLNLAAIRPLLVKNSKNFVKEYAGLNHLFQHCTTGLSEEYANIDETISTEVLEDMATWIIRLNVEH